LLTIRLLGFPVQIQLTFLILLFFVLDSGLNLLGMALWLGTVFVSILIHELGHAVSARRYGAHVHSITIHAFGGVTMWQEIGRPVRGWKRFVVAAAGSGVGLVIGLFLFALVRAGYFGRIAERVITSPWGFRLFNPVDFESALIFVLSAFIWVSVLWGLVNWLPIGGLDGSKMLREVLARFIGNRADYVASVIGLVVAGVLAVWMWRIGLRFGIFIVLFFAISDFTRVTQK
jgi:Zn-dependent protease